MALSQGEILLEEYKNCTEVLLNESRLFWSRYQVHLALNSGLLTVWSYLGGLPRSQLLQTGIICMASFGIVMAIVWFLNIERAYALSVYWTNRLNEIEQKLPPLRTFTRERYNNFWKTRNWFERRRITAWAVLAPLAFLAIWSILLYSSITTLFLN